MPDIRLVALDLDGTVFNDEKDHTPHVGSHPRCHC